MKLRAWCFFILWCGICLAHGESVQSIRVRDQDQVTSVFIQLSGPLRYHAFILKSPNRAVIDFEQAKLLFRPNQATFKKGVIANARIGHPLPTTSRIVFDLQAPAHLRVTQWKNHGLRLDIFALGPFSQPLQKITPPHVLAPSRPKPKHVPRPRALSAAYHSSPKHLRDVLVVIDAGHGGKDPGAMGPRHNAEKYVVLGIAYQLKRLIDKEPGMRAVMTRDGDYYVGLRQRLNIARKANADLFVSIHADAFNNRNSNGASVYALSPRGATSEAARWLAEKENYSELGGVDLSGLDDRNGLIRTVLLDLSQTATINSGLQVGGKILNNLGGMTALHHNKVEQARFVVLKSPDIPSVLVETGFISNPHEEFNLTSRAYQSRLGLAIFQGVKRYFWESPPHGTRIEAQLESTTHLAEQGEQRGNLG